MRARKNIFYLLSVVLIMKCGTNNITIYDNMNKDYVDLKSSFDSVFVDHFPDRIESVNSHFVYKNYPEANRVGFLLYDYGVAEQIIDSIQFDVKNYAIAKYTSKDSCLLIVDRYESKNEFYEIIDEETILTNDTCYSNTLPIPNFLDYKNNEIYDVYWRLTNDFEVCVLDANNNNSLFLLKGKNMKPSKQMPDAWKNGYSKGIVFSKQKKTVIYWSIMW